MCPQPGVVFWDGISFDRIPLVVFSGTLTAQQFVDDFLRTVLLPFLLQYPGLVFTQDNSRPLTARVATCQKRPWSAKSPDLFPIEHVWDMMGRRLFLPGNVHDLARQLEQIWQEIPQETIRVLYHSMSHCVAACIQLRGGYLLQLVTL
ncbi:transposable element Tc1 transposase [Trichonephila clavipes]|nr:transposable element Tc1 transposase [Trichonephila clavipes]